VLLCLGYSHISPVLSLVIPSPKPKVHGRIYPVRRTVLLERWTNILTSITNNRTHTAIPTWKTPALIQQILLKIQASGKKKSYQNRLRFLTFGRYSVQICGGTANKLRFHTAHILTITIKTTTVHNKENRLPLYTARFEKNSEQTSSVNWPLSHIEWSWTAKLYVTSLYLNSTAGIENWLLHTLRTPKLTSAHNSYP